MAITCTLNGLIGIIDLLLWYRLSSVAVHDHGWSGVKISILEVVSY